MKYLAAASSKALPHWPWQRPHRSADRLWRRQRGCPVSAIGDYRISGGAVEYWNADSQGRYTIETTVTITKTGSKSWTDWFNVFKNKKYDDIFSAKNMKLLNGDEKFEMPSKNDDVVCKPRFYTTDKTLFDKFVNGEEKMTLKIELARNQSKTFLVDVKNKTISGTI